MFRDEANRLWRRLVMPIKMQRRVSQRRWSFTGHKDINFLLSALIIFITVERSSRSVLKMRTTFTSVTLYNILRVTIIVLIRSYLLKKSLPSFLPSYNSSRLSRIIWEKNIKMKCWGNISDRGGKGKIILWLEDRDRWDRYRR